MRLRIPYQSSFHSTPPLGLSKTWNRVKTELSEQKPELEDRARTGFVEPTIRRSAALRGQQPLGYDL